MNPTLDKIEWVARGDRDELLEQGNPLEHGGRVELPHQETDRSNTPVGEYGLADGVISVLNRLYEFRGGLIVEKFLRENLRELPSLAGVLIEAHGALRGPFRPGTGTRMILEVVVDPEFPADQQLFLIARTKLPRRIARELLSTLEQGWWRNVPLPIRKKVELDIE